MSKSSYTEYSTDQLWTHCTADDRIAFKELYNREFKNLITYGLKIFPHKPDVKDALQEIFTDLWLNKSKRQISNIRLYLLKSLKYKLIKIKPIAKVIDLNALQKESETLSLLTNEAESNSKEIQTILSQLPMHQQEILHLKYYQGLSNTQIAEVLGIKYQSVSNRLHRTLNGFRKKIQKKISV